MTSTQPTEKDYLARYRAEMRVRRTVVNKAMRKFMPSEKLIDKQLEFDLLKSELEQQANIEMEEFLQGRI